VKRRSVNLAEANVDVFIVRERPRMRPKFSIAQATATLAAVLLSITVGPGHSADLIEIMPVGDSITEGYGDQCSYRLKLEALLDHPGCAYTFTGSQQSKTRCSASQIRHEGYSAKTADEVTGFLENTLQSHSADVLLVHLGSNDLFYGQSNVSTITDLEALLDLPAIDAGDLTVLLAGIIPWGPGAPFDNNNRDELTLSNELAEQIKTLAEQRRSAGEKVYFVDVNTGFDYTTMTVDSVHPNDTGERLIANRFLDQLNAIGASYSRLTANSAIPPAGTGFWFISTVDTTLTMPAGSKKSVRKNTAPCSTDQPCYTQQFDHNTGWQLNGNPYTPTPGHRVISLFLTTTILTKSATGKDTGST